MPNSRLHFENEHRLNSLESPCASLSLRRFIGISRRVLAARFIRARSVVISLAVLLLKTVVPGGTANKRAARRGIPCDIRSIRTNNSYSEWHGRPYSPARPTSYVFPAGSPGSACGPPWKTRSLACLRTTLTTQSPPWSLTFDPCIN